MKHCTACRHFYFDGGAHGYSELTPGSSASMRCLKAIWKVDLAGDGTTQQELYETLRKAETCGEFDLADYARANG